MRYDTLAIVQAIWKDITDRSGLSGEIDGIHDVDLAEMVGIWYRSINLILHGPEAVGKPDSDADRHLLRNVRGW